ncbi:MULTISPECIES: NADPH-dependent FMN reductase [Arthrobacter]|uniref:NADPH-dependent oxidoreductase n=1 Tax=Arthrobacter terricola TaxID=2547396 RepID=A0A4R5KB73_9MICC|nr:MULTISPECIES: NADPH-dependent FMN reductase [Arthrobacter]MBT8163042.1 NAD(P)H-dependent oxidoreductase [Arthrobacter sp. GN70]TDF91755.1 NADPH-dependent oxidoreductase [Arthrobacter terricola]
MEKLKLPVFSCSLDPSSRSRALAHISSDLLKAAGHDAPVLDLAYLELPPFDNDRVFDSPVFRDLHQIVQASDGVILAFPIYNWAPSSTVKSFIEATGATGDKGQTAAWFDKVVTFVCAAGLTHSYMATGILAQSMMYDFKCVLNPYTAYIADRDWETQIELTADRKTRLEKTVTVHAELATLLRNRSYRSDWEV